MKRDIVAALASAAEEINRPSSLPETLHAIVYAAQHSVPGFDHVGISTRHKDGRIETLAGTDQLVWDLDDLQYSLDEGPCVDSIKRSTVMLVEHAADDGRWPRYMPQAVERGLRAQLALRLTRDGEAFGGINLYSTASDTIDEDAPLIAELFATHAALALGWAREEEQLNEALSTRKMIGQAIGILMERYRIDQDRALQFLMRASQTSNVKLRDIAEELVSTTDEGLRKH